MTDNSINNVGVIKTEEEEAAAAEEEEAPLSCQYSHFVRQPRVRRQRDFKRYFRPETENMPYYYKFIGHEHGI